MGRLVIAGLLLIVLGVGTLDLAGHVATSVHIRVTSSGCGCTTPSLPAGKVLFDKTYTDGSFVRGVQDAMNSGPMVGDRNGGMDAYWYSFTFATAGGIVLQTYVGQADCVMNKTTLGVPGFGFNGWKPSPGIDPIYMAYHGKSLWAVLNSQIGLPI
jgi:hypothetical protein